MTPPKHDPQTQQLINDIITKLVDTRMTDEEIARVLNRSREWVNRRLASLKAAKDPGQE